MSNTSTIRVNFGRPMPLFPLHAATLLPHGIIQLNVFEPRYVQMVSEVLDSSGQIAMAVFEGKRWQKEYHGRPPLKPAVCVGQMVHHVKNDDDTYIIVLQGVCRARIVRELPSEAGRLYRIAMLEPIGDPSTDETILDNHRERLAELLTREPLTDLNNAEQFVEYLKREDVPANVVVELLAYTFLALENPARRYEYLAQPDPADRARLVEDALDDLSKLLRKARVQRATDAPRGCSWN